EMELPDTADVVIIGGGVMGVSTAYHLASRGCERVVLLERHPFFAAEATGKCAGGIRYQFSTRINIALSQISLPMLDRFEDEIGQPIDLRQCGYLFLLTNQEDVSAFRGSVALQHRMGIETEWLDPDEITSRVPLLNMEGVVAGTFHSADGLADPSGVVQGYVSAARRSGALLFNGIEVTGITLVDNQIIGVVTNQGEIASPLVVNAAGPWAATVGMMVGVDLPVVPIRRQIAVTTPIPDIPSGFPFIIDFAKSLYFHREGPGVLTGMSNRDEAAGFDQSVDERWESVHLESAMQRLPVLAEAGIASRWAGLYEVTPDAHPILGRVPEIEGFLVICGFSGHGFQHGPACGMLMAEEILDGGAHSLDIAPLDLSRFAEGRSIDEYHVV
ncbi:NAD(P)/FAD-dependent oxidoreductase, partial [Gemmatimonadota bacterium]